MNEPFEDIYDKYCKLIYTIAPEISSTEKEAGKIVSKTFLDFYKQKFNKQNSSSYCLKLIKLTIQAAKVLPGAGQKSNIKLTLFEHTPVLHKIICEQFNADNYCIENELSRKDLGSLLKIEFSLLVK